jgi:putative aldouronate transport system substrate-binding protein
MSGQTVDIINANSELNYVDYVKKGAFLPIEDLVQQYAPETYAMIPESFWNAMYVDGHMYGIPSYKDSCQMYCMLYNATMAENLGLDMSAVSIHNYRDIVPFLFQAKELRDEKYPEDASLPMTRNFPDLNSWAQHEVINGLAVVNVPGVEDFEGMGSGETVFNKYATAEFRDMCKTVAKMVTDGVLPYDLFNFDTSRVYNKQGKYILVDIGSGYVTVNKDQEQHRLGHRHDPLQRPDRLHRLPAQRGECVCAPPRTRARHDAAGTAEHRQLRGHHAALRRGRRGLEHERRSGRAGLHRTKNADPSNRGHYYWYGAQFGSFIHSDVPAGYPANFTEPDPRGERFRHRRYQPGLRV